jgi:hypothetical protein
LQSNFRQTDTPPNPIRKDRPTKLLGPDSYYKDLSGSQVGRVKKVAEMD